MKKSMLLAAAVFAVGTVCADPLVDDSYFTMEQLPTELTGTVFPGKDIDFTLEENATTGYVWSAVYDPRTCRVQLDHKASRANLAGAPGYVEVEIKPLTLEPCVVVLNYARPFEPDKAPAKTVKCTVVSQQVAPAPVPVVQPAPAAPAPAAPAPVVQPVPAATVIPPGTPMIVDDAYFRLASLPAALQANIFIGHDIDFDLQEFPEKGMFWTVGQYDTRLCYVKLKHDDADHFFESAKAEIEIKAFAAGMTYIDFFYGSGPEAKTLRVYLTLR